MIPMGVAYLLPFNQQEGMLLQRWGWAKGAEKASCGETVVQKGVLESPFLLCPLRVFRCFKANLNGAEQKRTLQTHPFGQPFLRTTPSPLLWKALKRSTVIHMGGVSGYSPQVLCDRTCLDLKFRNIMYCNMNPFWNFKCKVNKRCNPRVAVK